MTRTFICSSCGKYDFDALFDLRFHNRLCCNYVVADEVPILARQTVLFHGRTRPSLGIRHWEWYVGE